MWRAFFDMNTQKTYRLTLHPYLNTALTLYS